MQYFELFEALGRAIATIIRIKNRDKIKANDDTEKPASAVSPINAVNRRISPAEDFSVSVKAFCSLSDLADLDADIPPMPPNSRDLIEKSTVAKSSKEVGKEISTNQIRVKSHDGGMPPPERNHSWDNLTTREKGGTMRLKEKTRFGFDKLLSNRRSLDQLSKDGSRTVTHLNDTFQDKSSTPSPEIPSSQSSRSTLTKAALAKFYMEARYKNNTEKDVGSSEDEEKSTESLQRATDTRKWRARSGLTMFIRPGTLSHRVASEPSLFESPSDTSNEAMRNDNALTRSTDSLQLPIQTMDKPGERRIGSRPDRSSTHRPLSMASMNTSPLAERKATVTASARNSVINIFGGNTRGTGSLRSRAASEQEPKKSKYNTISAKAKDRPSILPSSEEVTVDKYATMSGLK